MEEVCNREISRRQKVMTIERPSSNKTVDDIGLRSDDAKRLLSAVQQFIATAQFKLDAELRSTCEGCGNHLTIRDYRSRTVDTLYGRITACCPRFNCSQCGLTARPTLGRSTAEFDEARAKLAAHLPFRVASNVLTTLLPADSGVTHTTIRNRTAQVAAGLERRNALFCDFGTNVLRVSNGFNETHKLREIYENPMTPTAPKVSVPGVFSACTEISIAHEGSQKLRLPRTKV